MGRVPFVLGVLLASCAAPGEPPARESSREPGATSRPAPGTDEAPPGSRGPLACPDGWEPEEGSQTACVRDEPAARCTHVRAHVASAVPMSLADAAGLQIRGIAADTDLSSSTALERNGRSGLEVVGERGGRWVRIQAFEAAGGLVLVRCDGEGGTDEAGAPDVGAVLRSADLSEAPEEASDPEPPPWLAKLPTEPPLGPERDLAAGFVAAMPADWRSHPPGESAPGAGPSPPDVIDATGGGYRIACLPFHEAPTVAELLDASYPVVADEALQTGSARLGSRVGSVMRSAAKIPTHADQGARRGRRVVRLAMEYAGIFRFVWVEGMRRCVLRYESPAGAANPPAAIDRLGASLPEVVRVVASLRER